MGLLWKARAKRLATNAMRHSSSTRWTNRAETFQAGTHIQTRRRGKGGSIHVHGRNCSHNDAFANCSRDKDEPHGNRRPAARQPTQVNELTGSAPVLRMLCPECLEVLERKNHGSPREGSDEEVAEFLDIQFAMRSHRGPQRRTHDIIDWARCEAAGDRPKTVWPTGSRNRGRQSVGQLNRR